ncbi:hypothetical protein SLS62_006451 [Diatrype stigma]|uniref:DUF1330 domain-containing protein n=1 Tax=Diatrype stigma TaxID=117547 RepID=A0AAN9YRW6_9PEZI
MVLCNLHLIALKPGYTIQSCLRELRANGIKPVVQARVLRWMITPTHISAGRLIGRNIRWDLLLILAAEAAASNTSGTTITTIPPGAEAQILARWTVACGLSSRALSRYATDSAALLRPGSAPPPAPHEVAPSPSSQNLEVSPELTDWIATALPDPLRDRCCPVSMLNLLAFRPTRRDQYKRYGAEFTARVGARHGARVKLVGRVVGHSGGGDSDSDDGAADGGSWDEIAFVHYPSVRHFAAMAASRDYQEVNHAYRLGALRDTFILCVVEVDDDGEIVGGQASMAML